MLTTGDALAKTLVKSQKVTFWSQKNNFECFFWLITVNDLRMQIMFLSTFSICIKIT